MHLRARLRAVPTHQDRRRKFACGGGAGALSFSGSGASICGSGSGGVSPASEGCAGTERQSKRWDWAWDHFLQRIHHLLTRHHLCPGRIAIAVCAPLRRCAVSALRRGAGPKGARPARFFCFFFFISWRLNAEAIRPLLRASADRVRPGPPASPALAVPPSPFAL